MNNASMPYINSSNAINWGGTVAFTNHDMSKYTMNNLELEEGNYIAIPVDEDPNNVVKYTYSEESTEVTLKYLFYEVIE